MIFLNRFADGQIFCFFFYRFSRCLFLYLNIHNIIMVKCNGKIKIYIYTTTYHPLKIINYVFFFFVCCWPNNSAGGKKNIVCNVFNNIKKKNRYCNNTLYSLTYFRHCIFVVIIYAQKKKKLKEFIIHQAQLKTIKRVYFFFSNVQISLFFSRFYKNYQFISTARGILNFWINK